MNALVAVLSPGGLAIVIALLVMALEAWLVRPDPLGFIASLGQPAWALPRAAAFTIPVFFYGIATYGAAAAIRAGDPGRWALAAVVAVLVGNAVLNHLLCRRRRIDWAVWFAVPLVLVAALAAHRVFVLDRVAGAAMGLVVLFLVYDVAWLSALARLNPDHAGRSSAAP